MALVVGSLFGNAQGLPVRGMIYPAGMFKNQFIVRAMVLSVSQLMGASQTLAHPQKEVVDSWLSGHPGYRLATDTDCKCDEELRTIRKTGYGGRWKPLPGYHPYIAVGDFNGDGSIDFAVAVIRNDDPSQFATLIFNGPITSKDGSPAYMDKDLKLTGVGFFFGPPRPKPYRLVVGPFESEGYVFVPQGKTYRAQDISSENE